MPRLRGSGALLFHYCPLCLFSGVCCCPGCSLHASCLRCCTQAVIFSANLKLHVVNISWSHLKHTKICNSRSKKVQIPNSHLRLYVQEIVRCGNLISTAPQHRLSAIFHQGSTPSLPCLANPVDNSSLSAQLCYQALLDLKILFESCDNDIQVLVKWWGLQQCSKNGENINGFALVRGTEVPQRRLNSSHMHAVAHLAVSALQNIGESAAKMKSCIKAKALKPIAMVIGLHTVRTFLPFCMYVFGKMK